MTLQVDPVMGNWEPFGRPLFSDPSARGLDRVGVVDIGSNSVRLVVFDGAARSPAYFFNEKVMCGLGAGLSETGQLNPEGRDRALAALTRFQALAESMDVPPLTAVATAAVREATDGPAFCDAVRAATGIDIHVIEGKEEARLSAQGVLLGWPTASGLVSDIGGSSMELATLSGGRVGARTSVRLGPLKLQSIDGGQAERRAHIDQVLASLGAPFDTTQDRLFLVGGSWRAIARIDMHRRNYPLRVLHEYRMSRSDLQKTADLIARQDPDKLRVAAGVSGNRMALLPYALDVLTALVDQVQPAEIAISSYGIREGLLYEQMPDAVRDRDPLIEACRFAEAKDARMPGFGKVLFKFILPLFADASPDRMRLIKAACLLHDVSWRAHPDYRAEVCFDYATRANLGGLTHPDRVFLGLSLLHRYTKKRAGSRFEHMSSMLSDEAILTADRLGKAMRFGAMLWLRADEQMAELDLRRPGDTLVVRLPQAKSAMFGEVAQARFRSLASSFGADPAMEILQPDGVRAH